MVCPISGAEFDGYKKFTLLWSCGCVIANKVFENMEVNQKCPNCNKKFKEKDKIDITPDPKRGESLRKRLVEKFVQRKREKKSIEVNKEQEGENKEKANKISEEMKSNKRQKIDGDEYLLKESEEAWKLKTKLIDSKLVDRSELSKMVKNKLEVDETYKSLFNDEHKEVKEQDYLCRSGYGV